MVYGCRHIPPMQCDIVNKMISSPARHQGRGSLTFHQVPKVTKVSWKQRILLHKRSTMLLFPEKFDFFFKSKNFSFLPFRRARGPPVKEPLFQGQFPTCWPWLSQLVHLHIENAKQLIEFIGYAPAESTVITPSWNRS